MSMRGGMYRDHAAPLGLDALLGLRCRHARAEARSEHVAEHAADLHAHHGRRAVDSPEREREHLVRVVGAGRSRTRARATSSSVAATPRRLPSACAPGARSAAGSWIKSAIDRMRRPCSRANTCSSGMRAIVPSSFMISQITPAGVRPARRARSTEPSVWPARCKHAAGHRAQREDVTGADDVAALGRPARPRRESCARDRGADARRHALRAPRSRP